MRWPIAVSLVSAMALVLGAGGPAGAQGASAGGYSDGSGGGVRVEAPGTAGGEGDAGSARTGSSRECAYFAVVPGDPPSVGGRISDTSGLEAGTPVVLQCRDTTTGEVVYSLLQTWDPTAAIATGPSAAQLAEIAANSVTVPAPATRTWPAGGVGLVNLPVWLRVDNWDRQDASASAGGLTATVEAVPVRAVWIMDGESVVCTDSGSVWTPTGGPAGSSCSHTFRHSSGAQPDGRFEVSVSVVWRLSWSATDGQVGDLGEVTSPVSVFGLRIEESQALVAPGQN
jgi:hypothetical protein